MTNTNCPICLATAGHFLGCTNPPQANTTAWSDSDHRTANR